MASSDKRRAQLLGRLLKMREIEHRRAAIEAAQALSLAQRSEQLAARARALANMEIRPQEVDLADDLARRLTSGNRLRAIAQTVEQQAAREQSVAQLRMQAERVASRRKDQLEERRAELAAESAQRAAARQNHGEGRSRRIGTEHE